MKKYILIKQSPSIQFAHLYEHIICMQLNKLLKDKNLYLYLDYDLIGKTYHGGLICIEFIQYYKNKLNFLKLLSNLDLVINEETITLGINQLIAEKELPFGFTGYINAIKELELINSKKWISIDKFDMLDAKTIRRKSASIYIAEGSKLRSKKLLISISLKEVDRSIVPLFRQLGHFIMVNLVNIVCDAYGYYDINDSFKSDKSVNKLTDILNVGLDNVNLDSQFIEVAQDLIKIMIDCGAFIRFARQLSSMSYAKQPNETVNFERNYEDTLIFVGAKGWKTIAIKENIDKLLEKSEFEFNYGKQKISIPLIKKLDH